MQTTGIELGVATASSLGISYAVSADPLLTALITFGVSVVTIVGTEAIKLAVAWLKKKRENIEKEDKPKDE